MAIIRQVSSKTAEGLSTEIAKAYVDGLGFDERGIETEIGGVAERVEIDMSWPHGREETSQVLSLDFSSAIASLATTGINYDGVEAANDVNSYAFSAVGTGIPRSQYHVSLGGVSRSTDVEYGNKAASEVAEYIRVVLAGTAYSTFVKSLSIAGNVLTVELFVDFGTTDLAVSRTTFNDNGQSNGNPVDVTPTPTLVTAHVAKTPERVFNVKVSATGSESNSYLPSSFTHSITIPAGRPSNHGLDAGKVRATIEELDDSAGSVVGYQSISVNNLTNVATISMDETYAVEGFTITLELQDSANPSDTAPLFRRVFTASTTTAYIYATSEANGTVFFEITKPAIGKISAITYEIPVTIPDNQTAAQISERMRDGILNYVIDSATGRTVSSFLNVYVETSARTTGPDSSGTTVDIENFKIFMEWGPGGRVSATVPSATDFLKKNSLVGETGVTAAYVGTIDVNSAVTGKTYTVISLGDSTLAQRRALAGLASGDIAVGDRFTAVTIPTANITMTVNEFVGGERTVNVWDSFSTSSVLQPGGDTTHFATLIKV